MKVQKQNYKTTQSDALMDDLLLPAEVVVDGEQRYISLQKTPKKLILYKEDGSAKIISNPTFSSGKYVITDSSFTYAYYVPSEEVTISRAIAKLGLDLSLDPSASTGSWVDLLNLKLAQTSQALTTWDTYNIYKVAYNHEDLVAALASLPLSSSVVVNIDDASVSIGSWLVKKGDLICRDSFGDLHHIKGSNGGFYFPSTVNKIDNGTVFKLGFQFSTASPIEGESPVVSETISATTPYTNMTVQFPSIDEMEPALCYANRGVIETSKTETFAFLTTNDNRRIEPIIYYYITTNNQEERIFFPSEFVVEGETFKINNPTKMSLVYEVR